MNSQESSDRGSWGSKIAFVFAAAGPAIGLGSIWRFPLMVGAHGGGVKFLTDWGFLGEMDLLFGNIVFAVGALFVSLFASYAWGIKEALKEIASGNDRFRLKPLWVFSLKFLVPLTIITILIFIRRLPW